MQMRVHIRIEVRAPISSRHGLLFRLKLLLLKRDFSSSAAFYRRATFLVQVLFTYFSLVLVFVNNFHVQLTLFISLFLNPCILSDLLERLGQRPAVSHIIN